MLYRENCEKSDRHTGEAPLIGIVVCGVEQNRQFVTDTYVHAIAASGGIPALIPFWRERDMISASEEAILSYVKLYDGFLFPGGGDIAPTLFGQERQPGCGDTNIEFDRFQIRLMQQVLCARKPLLAICRGMQVLNVACSGSLYQDLHLRMQHTNEHMQRTQQRHEAVHRVYLNGGKLRQWMGPWVDTNSYHHQAVARIGRGLTVRGQTADGVAEVLEGVTDAFVLGVQWHPEAMYDTSQQMRELFKRFIQSSKGKE